MTTATKIKEFLTTAQLAERWDIHPGTLENWRGQGKGPPYVKLTKKRRSPVLYRLSDIIEYERRMTIKGD